MKHFILFTLFIACTSNSRDLAITQITQAEKEFAQMAKDVGIKEAFIAFADADAVLMRNDSLIIGLTDIRTLMAKQNYNDVSLDWSPDFVDAARSGDLGYTYGEYVYSYKDSSGTLQSIKGVFHTVWKQQVDGSWKFVWD